ncbi:hydantoinase B/oxoprolinase family protein [Novosphingobium sp.]|uniref:hydantoinase B/oxoprolinase family protein n=1 Tax=Novosphingobium sp. TaxID=1874826 RepID=UPI0038B87305
MTDPILLEVLRCKLEAIAEDGSRTIIRTAISPIVAESGDCSCTIYSPEGDLVVGGGAVRIHFRVGGDGIRKIFEMHGDSIADGDIFLVNDPYNGGGLHAQDVFIHVPIFANGRLLAWVSTSAHMIDMGGMVPGSFSTSATEVYQEAFRVPPVRLYRAGVEQRDVWAILRNNVRMANVVEMDMRSLIAGANVVKDQLVKLTREYDADVFADITRSLSALTEAEVRRRIAELEPGTYRATSWSEWTDEFYRVPCTLTVTKDHLTFDFSGASAQTDHFLNSKRYVINSLIGTQLSAYLGQDLPFNEGVFRVFDVVCEPGSILDAQAPAPIGGPHLDVGQAALEVAMRALNYALGASPRSRARKNMAGPSASSGLALHTLAGTGLDGNPIGWLMLDGGLTAACAGHDRDAPNMTYQAVGNGVLETVDIEVLESWYPIRINSRLPRAGTGGAGEFTAGRPVALSYSIDAPKPLSMTIMGNRERLPLAGMAGGMPGATTRMGLIRAGDDTIEDLACHQDGIRLERGDTVLCDVSNGGGWGDPLNRDPALVLSDVGRGLLTADEARQVYGVIEGGTDAIAALRNELRQQRLARAKPAPHPVAWTDELRAATEGIEAPLAAGVVQRGHVAVAEASGAALAVSPAPWTDGCPYIEGFGNRDSTVDYVAYLDPVSGQLLAVDATPKGNGCSFEIAPQRWTSLGAEVAA